jgi:hypothetical protein
MATFNVSDEIDRLLYEAFSFDEPSTVDSHYTYYEKLANSNKTVFALPYWLSTMMYGFRVVDPRGFFAGHQLFVFPFIDIADMLLEETRNVIDHKQF